MAIRHKKSNINILATYSAILQDRSFLHSEVIAANSTLG
jgi:hypothetical protein